MKLTNPILNVRVATADAETIAELLASAGAVAIEERDSSTMTSASDDQVVLVAGFEDIDDRLSARTTVERTGRAVEIVEVDELDDDWRVRWRAFFKPVILSRLQVVTPWMDPPRDDLMTVTIDPGQAFGTGGHATTKLILEMLEGLSEGGALPSPILDVGTGSGILAFAARMLGAQKVLGVDIDEESVKAFWENAERNGIRAGIDCRLGSTGDVEGRWPLVLANIQIDAFRVVAADIASRVSPTGRLLVSGLLTDQVDECLDLFPEFRLVERRDEGEWVALCLETGR